MMSKRCQVPLRTQLQDLTGLCVCAHCLFCGFKLLCDGIFFFLLLTLQPTQHIHSPPPFLLPHNDASNTQEGCESREGASRKEALQPRLQKEAVPGQAQETGRGRSCGGYSCIDKEAPGYFENDEQEFQDACRCSTGAREAC